MRGEGHKAAVANTSATEAMDAAVAKLVTISSPELFVAKQEYITALCGWAMLTAVLPQHSTSESCSMLTKATTSKVMPLAPISTS